MAAKNHTKRCKLSPPELAQRWGVSPDKIIAFIRQGELRAIDVATRRGGRPRYLIDLADIQNFEERRAVIPAVRSRRRSRRSNGDATEYF